MSVTPDTRALACNTPAARCNTATLLEVDALSLDSAQFIAAMAARHGWATEKSLDRYKSLFREGHARGLEACTPAPIARRLSEPSGEGEVLKFTQKHPAIPAGAAEWGIPTDGPAFDRLSRFEHLETESVLIPMIGRTGRPSHTLCISSQVGCAMGCTFCETAQMGLIRSLTPGEIVGQWFAATHLLGNRPKNIVFMGMGEPLDNYDNVIQAIAVLKDHNGAAMPISKITISTVGRLDGLAKLAAKLHEPGWHRLNLAVSINAAEDELRSSIMPINRGMPLAELQQTLTHWPIYGGGKICLEYVLIPGVNDDREHAAQIGRLLAPIDSHFKATRDARTPRCMLNVIPYNPRRDSPWPAPSEERVTEFLAWLGEENVYAKRRRTKGRRMMGACGQLGNEQIRRRKPVALTVGQQDDEATQRQTT
ncbi:MAG: 23S rRNA (adenine(2503)-C(2))-methyltransferase RlmN [Phycisphaerales bacterium]|nr:23S rRNA (adenine(2503)-C(2))-methyltransferase RlmN [Phycisphaerales bacterium]